MNVNVRLDPKLVWVLTDKAEEKGLTLPEFLGELAARAVPRPSAKSIAAEHTRNEVARLHGEGFTDAEIAARVGRVQEHVARVRRGMGLKPNRRRK